MLSPKVEVKNKGNVSMWIKVKMRSFSHFFLSCASTRRWSLRHYSLFFGLQWNLYFRKSLYLIVDISSDAKLKRAFVYAASVSTACTKWTLIFPWCFFYILFFNSKLLCLSSEAILGEKWIPCTFFFHSVTNVTVQTTHFRRKGELNLLSPVRGFPNIYIYI